MCKLSACLSVVALMALMILLGCACAADPAPASAPCPPVGPETWHYSVTPYVWLSSVSGEVGVAGREASVDAGIGDIIKHLNWVTELHAEASKGRLGFYVDPTYVKLSVGGHSLRNPASVGYREWLIDFAGTYRLMEKPTASGGLQSADLIAGGRYWNLNTRLSIENVGSASGTKQWVDPIVGLRYSADLNPRWSVVAQGDIGGFGVSSEFTWSVAPVFVYHLSENRALVLGYRALGVDYSTGSGLRRFKLDTTYHGPLLGYEFGF